MKFNPLSIVKKKYSFEFSDDYNVETPEKMKDAMDLICWAEEENARHLEEDTSGSVVIIKQNKKGVVKSFIRILWKTVPAYGRVLFSCF